MTDPTRLSDERLRKMRQRYDARPWESPHGDSYLAAIDEALKRGEELEFFKVHAEVLADAILDETGSRGFDESVTFSAEALRAALEEENG